MKIRTSLLASLALSSCATPESQLGSALREAGLSPRVSACMAERMVDRLSLGQLLKLRSLGSLSEERPGSAAEFMRKVRALGDPEIVGVATSSLAVCGLGL
jgi:hypothetical protein